MPIDYPFETLDPKTFEQIVVVLCRAVIGNGVTTFGDGPDGGREATYEGPVAWSNTTLDGDDSWHGYVVIQAKHRASFDSDPKRNESWLKKQIKDEITSWIDPDSRRNRFPQYLLFVTNARLSPAVGGGIDNLEKYITEEWGDTLSAHGLKGWKIWHRDQVVSLVSQFGDVRRAFPALLTNPEERLVDRFDKLASFFQPQETRDLLMRHASAALRHEQWVNFGEAGDDSQKPLHQVIVDLPVRTRTNDREQALCLLMKAGEHVLKKSLADRAVPRHVILTGAPGNGKSTLSRYVVQLYRMAFMAQDMPERQLTLAHGIRSSIDRLGLTLPRQQRWPMRIDLANWAAADPRQDIPYFFKWLAQKVGERADLDVTTADMRRWLKEWPWLIVFDGLDEVTSPPARRSIINNIIDFVGDVDDADADVFVIVTTRPGGYADELPSESFAEYELDYLSKEEAVNYGELITHGRLADNQDRRMEVLSRFHDAIDDPSTARLLKTPLQVLIITFILEHLGSLPANRYGLFWAYYETLFKREASKENHLARFISSRSQDVTFLHEVVGATLQVRSEAAQDSQARLSLDELRLLADARLRSIGYEDDIERGRLTDELIEAATRRLVLLVPGGADSSGRQTVMFEVRSLQELMAARRLSSGTDHQIHARLKALAPSPHWRNTWVFMAGRLFAEPQESRWNLVTDQLATFDRVSGWPGWLIPVAPGIAAELLDDGLASTKPNGKDSSSKLLLGRYLSRCQLTYIWSAAA